MPAGKYKATQLNGLGSPVCPAYVPYDRSNCVPPSFAVIVGDAGGVYPVAVNVAS